MERVSGSVMLNCLSRLNHNILILTNKEDLTDDENLEGKLGCSDHESQEFSILK